SRSCADSSPRTTHEWCAVMAAGGRSVSEGSSVGRCETSDARDERANGMPPGRERMARPHHRRTRAGRSLARSKRAASMKFVTSELPPDARKGRVVPEVAVERGEPDVDPGGHVTEGVIRDEAAAEEEDQTDENVERLARGEIEHREEDPEEEERRAEVLFEDHDEHRDEPHADDREEV